MKTALVFGASGQVGAPLLERLNHAGWRVYAVSRQPHSDAPGRHWLRGDFASVHGLPDAVDAIFSCGPLDLFARWHAGAGIRCPRIVAVDIDERVQLAIECVDARKAGLDDLARAGLASGEQVSEFGQRLEREVVVHRLAHA